MTKAPAMCRGLLFHRRRAAALTLLALGLFGTMPGAFAQQGNKGVIMRKAPATPPEETAPPPRSERRDSPETQAPPQTPPPAPPPAATRKPQPGAVTWPASFNDYFESDLASPTFDEALATLVNHLNRRTVMGGPPEEELARFERWLAEFKRNTPRDQTRTDTVEAMYTNLTRWVELEALFAQEPNRDLLKRLTRVVASQSELDPGFDVERRDRILATVEGQGLFVPSSILFGYVVLPYRPVKLPKGYQPFESLVKPEFTDTSHRATATYDFIEAPGPIFRVDFETVRASRARVEQSADGKQFALIQEWQPKPPRELRGPAILDKPFRARYMQLIIESETETAVLRNPRVFALKEPAAAIAPLVAESPLLDGSFKEAPWPREAQIDGFINTETRAFAEAQTTVRVCYTPDSLFIAVYAREPRMSTMAATLTARDAALWDEESFMIEIAPAGGAEYRFVVNPRGAQFDSRDGDDAWDGDWTVATQSWPVGWSAEIGIPFSTLSSDPSGDDWRINFARTRRNVTNERSLWSYSSAGRVPGALIFPAERR